MHRIILNFYRLVFIVAGCEGKAESVSGSARNPLIMKVAFCFFFCLWVDRVECLPGICACGFVFSHGSSSFFVVLKHWVSIGPFNLSALLSK